VTLVAYILARRYARDRRLSFGTGKVNALAGFASAVLLAGFAFVMAIESGQRLVSPVSIQFDQALIVATVGLLVNAGCALLLNQGREDGGEAHPADDHDHGHADHGRRSHEHGHSHAHGHGHHHGHSHGHGHDHNLQAAYLHVLADALTSVLAIVALLAGKLAGWAWLDPVMGLVGGALVAHWSWGLLKQTGSVLLDRQVPKGELDDIRSRLEVDGDRVLDLHVWSIGPGIEAAEIVIRTASGRQADDYRARLPRDVVHCVIEVRAMRPLSGG
jgi:cation diffusion facilitator family transporter